MTKIFCLFFICINSSFVNIAYSQGGPYSNNPSKENHIGGGSAMIRTCETKSKTCEINHDHKTSHKSTSGVRKIKMPANRKKKGKTETK